MKNGMLVGFFIFVSATSANNDTVERFLGPPSKPLIVGQKRLVSITVDCACGGDGEKSDIYISVVRKNFDAKGNFLGYDYLITQDQGRHHVSDNVNYQRRDTPNAVFKDYFEIKYKGYGREKIYINVWDWNSPDADDFLGDTDEFDPSQNDGITLKIHKGETGELETCTSNRHSCNGKTPEVTYTC